MTFWKVTLEEVVDLTPIEGADFIELATIKGWRCVVKTGEFSVGDFGIYFPIDSLLPRDDPRFAFMEPRGWRVKTAKLRGQISQGLFMPCTISTEDEARQIEELLAQAEPGDNPNLADIFGIEKYNPPLPIGGKQAGPFPGFVRKTDQERVQNLHDDVRMTDRSAGEFEITEKLDGTSCTVFWFRPDEVNDPRFGVCSRNWEMQLDDDNAYAQAAKANDLQAKLAALGRNLAIQGEIIGPGIQGNKYKLTKREFYVFDVFDIDAGRYLTSTERCYLVRDLELKHVPFVLHKADWPLDVDRVVEFADGQSALCNQARREGVVFKAKQPDEHGETFSFKAISNKWLLKHE